VTWFVTTCVASASQRLESGLPPERRSQGGLKVALSLGGSFLSNGGLRAARGQERNVG